MANTLIAQLNAPAMLQKINQQLATVASLLLVIACAYVLAEISWKFYPQQKEVVTPRSSSSRLPMNTKSDSKNFNRLTASNLFGVNKKVVVPQTTKAPETRLDLTLKGLLAATPMEMASAIIARGRNGEEKIYSVGDKMPGGILIKEIHSDRVVLDRGGRLEILRMPRDDELKNLSSRGTAKKSGYAGPKTGRNNPAGSALKEIRANILKNPTSFGEYALPMIVRENGRQVGYRLQPQQKGQMLSELGIQPMDVITEINGVKLDKPQNGISALRKLTTAKNLNLVVKRNGAEVPLNISLQ